MRSGSGRIAQLLLVAAIGGAAFVAVRLTGSKVKVTTPDVSEMNYGPAVVTLIDSDLCVRVDRAASRSGSKLPAIVLKQSPPPGARVHRWTVVTLSVGQGLLQPPTHLAQQTTPCPSIALHLETRLH
jgi:beta-lactam-binding protein with PASTA domain